MTKDELKFELEQFLEMVEFDKQRFLDIYKDKEVTIKSVVKLLDIYCEDLKELLEEK